MYEFSKEETTLLYNRIIALEKSMADSKLTLDTLSASLSARIKELEEARAVQIQLNERFKTHTHQEQVKTFTFLDFFKKK